MTAFSSPMVQAKAPCKGKISRSCVISENSWSLVTYCNGNIISTQTVVAPITDDIKEMCDSMNS